MHVSIPVRVSSFVDVFILVALVVVVAVVVLVLLAAARRSGRVTVASAAGALVLGDARPASSSSNY